MTITYKSSRLLHATMSVNNLLEKSDIRVPPNSMLKPVITGKNSMVGQIGLRNQTKQKPNRPRGSGLTLYLSDVRDCSTAEYWMQATERVTTEMERERGEMTGIKITKAIKAATITVAAAGLKVPPQ